ncbi:MAG: phage baseplate protein [Blastocatellia bacterium]
MRAISATQLLNLWERGLQLPPPQRALLLASVARPEAPPDQIAELSVGRRDAALLDLRETIFGSHLISLADCPACGECLEIGFDIADIRVEPDRDAPERLSFTRSGYELSFRAPNGLDLAELMDDANASLGETRSRLLERCLLEARFKGRERKVEQLPARVVEAVVERMAQADPQADVRLAMTCPACGRFWQAAFDIASYLWSEIDALAHRLLGEVHTLARAYGWREADILSMSPLRRQFYLEMVRG